MKKFDNQRVVYRTVATEEDAELLTNYIESLGISKKDFFQVKMYKQLKDNEIDVYGYEEYEKLLEILKNDGVNPLDL